MLSKEYIARTSLVVREGYPFDHWMFIWNGEVIRVNVNKDAGSIFGDFKDMVSEEEISHIKQFVDKKLEELYDTPDPKSGD